MSETEAGFQQALRQYALLKGYFFYHTHDSRRSDPGFPDTAIVIPGDALILAELKVGKNRVSPAQQAWLAALRTVHRVEAYVWRPPDWADIEHRLSGGPLP